MSLLASLKKLIKSVKQTMRSYLKLVRKLEKSQANPNKETKDYVRFIKY